MRKLLRPAHARSAGGMAIVFSASMISTSNLENSVITLHLMVLSRLKNIERADDILFGT